MNLINHDYKNHSTTQRMAAIFPWAMLGIAVLYLAGKAMPPRIGPEDYNLLAVDSIPVLDEGRIKPLDSLASVSLMSISSRSEFEDADGKLKPAIVWLLDVMSGPNPLTGPAAEHKVFRIENDQVLSFLGLESRPGSYRYSIREILMPASKFVKVKREFDRVSQINSKKQTLYEQKIADLSRKVRIYTELNARNATIIPPQTEGQQWQSVPEIDEKICKPMQMQFMVHVNSEVAKRRPQLLKEIQEAKYQEMEAKGTDWKAITEEQKKEIQQELAERLDRAVEQERREGMAELNAEYANQERKEFSPAAEAFTQLLRNWEAARTWQNRPTDKRRKADAEEDLKKQNRLTEEFNKSVVDYKDKYLKLVPEEEALKTVRETYYNRLAPFYHCAALFILAFILGCASWVGWTQPLNRASTLVCLLALTVHSIAMLARIYLQGRPPVTNLYSSALFIGWGCVGVCLILERFYQNGMGNVVGSFLGFATMIVAHHLGMGKDTLEKLEAVLDTNFWLATHVTTVTLGYAATFIAGFIGVIYIVRGVFTKSLDPSSNRALSSMLYGILCFATLLSFVGTVLGGIWADQSWGRFWGWDPKENGAVLIVLWNSLILHARWSGLVKNRGIAVLSLFGNMITVWSWFGTNQLQIGLHSYGFDSSLARGCRYVWLGHLALIGIGLLPLKFWRSFSDETVRERAEQAKARLKKEGIA